MRSVTPEVMEADARAFFDYLAARPEVRGERFGTTGYCMGGRTSLIVAGRVPERVAAAMSFHGGGWPPRTPAAHTCSPTASGAAVYVGGAADDASYTVEDEERLDLALTDAGVEHVMVVSGDARLRRHRQRSLRRTVGGEALAGDAGVLRPTPGRRTCNLGPVEEPPDDVGDAARGVEADDHRDADEHDEGDHPVGSGMRGRSTTPP